MTGYANMTRGYHIPSGICNERSFSTGTSGRLAYENDTWSKSIRMEDLDPEDIGVVEDVGELPNPLRCPSPCPCAFSWSNLGIVVAIAVAVVLVVEVSSKNNRNFCQEAAAVRTSP